MGITIFSRRKAYKICNYPYTNQFFCFSRKCEASRSVKHKDGDYYFHHAVSQELPDKKIGESSTIMDVDLDLNFLVVASTTSKKFNFFVGEEIKNKRNVYKNMGVRLQS